MTAQGPSILLEIGTEEVPARFLPKALAEIRELGSRLFNEYRIGFSEMQSYATPRRIALLVHGVAARQNDVVKEVFGPAKKAAYDSEGKPTKAAEGFAKSLGIGVTELKTGLKGKGEYLVAMIEEKGSDTLSVLSEVLPKIILGLHFPKAMRWGNSSLTFVRPIQWILALMGSEKIPFEIDGIKSGTTTRGHRFLAPASFQPRDISSYINALEKSFVLVDQDKRQQTIRKGIETLITDPDKQPLIDEELLGMVTYLVEYPVPVLCSFSSEYLRLPKELLLTVMKDHQKYFGVEDRSGMLVNNFIVISNTKTDNADMVRTGAERVIKARFDDAKFYFQEDRKKKLEDRVEDLKAVTFHDKLGSLYEKNARVVKNAAALSEKLRPGVRTGASRAALLSKADLITGVVREFPELQGIMGKYYAEHDKEDSEVATALEEQYLPKNYGDRVPSTDCGAFVSIADRSDNVASFFSIGLVPTGSEDPFALRRQAMGIVSILLEREYPITLGEVFAIAADTAGRKDEAGLLNTIQSFMEQRVEFIFQSEGNPQDSVRALLADCFAESLIRLRSRLKTLAKFRASENANEFLLAIKRVNNITPKETLPAVDASLLEQPEEKLLYDAVMGISKGYEDAMAKADFDAALDLLMSLNTPINTFFDKVLVMDKDDRKKNNRLSLLQSIWSLAIRIADFSKLQ